MKTIEPQPIWYQGQEIDATVLNTYATNVTLGTSATFAFVLQNDTGLQLNTGSLLMIGADYVLWSSDDSYAWEWVAGQLKVTITGDVPTPTPPTQNVQQPTA